MTRNEMGGSVIARDSPARQDGSVAEIYTGGERESRHRRLGKPSAQDSPFECGQAFRALVGNHSFYVYLADHRHELFSDEIHPEPPPL